MVYTNRKIYETDIFEEFLLIIRIRKKAVNSAKKLGEEVLNKDKAMIDKLITMLYIFFLFTSPRTRCPSGCSSEAFSNFSDGKPIKALFDKNQLFVHVFFWQISFN